jgi:hypothetical protein
MLSRFPSSEQATITLFSPPTNKLLSHHIFSTRNHHSYHTTYQQTSTNEQITLQQCLQTPIFTHQVTSTHQLSASAVQTLSGAVVVGAYSLDGIAVMAISAVVTAGPSLNLDCEKRRSMRVLVEF